MNYSWLIPLLLMLGLSFVGVFYPSEAIVLEHEKFVSGDIAWMLTASCLVLLMTPGLAFFYGGMVSRSNIISTMFQSYMAIGIMSLLWVVVGFSLAFGESYGGIVGNPWTYFMFEGVGFGPNADFAPTFPFVLFALFQLKFAIITPALVTGAFAERIRFSAYLLFICLYGLFIYSPVAHWTWHPQGFLRQMGVLDFAGGTVVHMSAGFAALAGAMILGRRKSHLESVSQNPANIPFVMLGTGMLWFGWFGFNAGSALAANGVACQAFLTTNTAAAAAMMTWLFFDGVQGRKPSAMGACIAAVVGLVAITPAAGFVTVGQSMFVGSIASIASNLAIYWKSKSSIDDTLDVFPCHGVGGMMGMLFTGIFAADKGLLYGQTGTFAAHLFALVIVAVYTFFGSYLMFKITGIFIPLRVSEEHEEIGLDQSQHGEAIDESIANS